MPPVQAHSDAIIFNDGEVFHIDSMDDAHSETHHKNDTEEEKNTEHHHHCIFLGISSAIITAEFQFQFVQIFQTNKKTHFHKVLNTASFLDQLFQPPIV
ncbi:hypothetical protein PG913_05900 [Tenacibaculum pacificus]|uniref:hypothetical protein n=1 Tax=Tenacibaculum pacificus TaxID=3018314 RepID=UPI0022F3C7A8|nr:hypothetical protein [Tenacibaculum pacificus]WBX74701.1 hypothetical protein PG913_05900 [Tenacibaculum pacificus]